MPTTYFLGAGASKADHFPITRELLCAVAAWLTPGRRKVAQGTELFFFLHSAFGVSLEELRTAAAQWREHCAAVTRAEQLAIAKPPERLPELTDVLSTLDILLADEGGFGLGTNASRALRGKSIRQARDQAATAIAQGFNELHSRLPNRRGSPLLVDRFVTKGIIGNDDTLITTNWDILLDTARDRSFGSTPADYGTDAELNTPPGRSEDRMPKRPSLLKLHGSLNWLYCPRCSHLRIDIAKVTAPDGYNPNSKNQRSKCSNCGMPCAPLLVTPTFLKSYHNRHLLNIWAGALEALADSGRWVFIGYSLPSDDIHIKALLLKAKRMRIDKVHKPPEVRVVTHKRDDDLELRYRRLFGDCPTFEISTKGFGAYVDERARQREKVIAKSNQRKAQKERAAEARKRKRAKALARRERGRRKTDALDGVRRGNNG
jgi:hypothetical protein